MKSKRSAVNQPQAEVTQGTLFVCATPIGNLKDVSPHLVETLSQVGTIAAEATQPARRLLSALQVRCPELIHFREDCAESATRTILQRLENGTNVALVSEAGTPGVCDPAWQIVAACRREGIPVVSVSGPSALSTALAVSGVQIQSFEFLGFLPHKSSSRLSCLEAALERNRPIVFFESPHRLCDTASDLLKLCGSARQIVVLRELTKLHEEHIQCTLEQLVEQLKEQAPRGEYVVVLPALEQETKPFDEEQLAAQLGELLSGGMSKKSAIAFATRWLAAPKNLAYRLVEAACSASEN
jgi:16S rRNA (cytidine1402-2'-O)-methyltransferase